MACTCNAPTVAKRSTWWVVMYKHHHSTKNGLRSRMPIPSKYSFVKCTICGQYWTTKASYVDDLDGPRRCVCNDF